VKGAISPLEHQKEKEALINAGLGAMGIGQGLTLPASSAQRSLERNPSVLSRKELIK
jgi:hypothetical protein|tara:strand:- start:1529 stop:1699 length:171 start_codon:yes stop_codon:yes gene_type:complete